MELGLQKVTGHTHREKYPLGFFHRWVGALEILCQSGSISNTKGLNDGISDRYRGNITTYS